MTSPRPALTPDRIPAAHWLAGALVALVLHAGLLLALGPGLGDLRSPPTLVPGAGSGGMRISLEGRLGSAGDAPGDATPRPVAPPAPPRTKARAAEHLPPPRHPARAEPPVRIAARVVPTAPKAEHAAPPARETSSGTDVAAGPVAAIPGAADGTSATVGSGARSDYESHDGTAGGGTGNGGREGGGTAGAGGAGDAYFDAVFARVVSALEYPRRARLERIQGTVVLRLRLDRAGRIDHVEVAESSGSSLLDRQALRIVRRAAPFGPVPATLDDRSLAFELPLEFVLTDDGTGG